jgi:HEAT repeat protein
MVLSSVVLVFSLAQAAPPRVPPAQPRPQSAASKDADLAAIVTGWSAVEAGQYDAAVKAADAVLQRRPWDTAAHVLRIHALAKASPDRGHEAYERWLKAGRAEDAAMLEPVTIAVLQKIAAGTRPDLRTAALRALLFARVAGAREALEASKSDEEARVELDVDAARRGDAAAIERLSRLASGGGSPSVARSLVELGASGEPGLLLLAKSANPPTRAAAVDALGGVKSAAARDAVSQLQQDPDPAVRIACTIALARMGDTGALATVDQMLASGVPDVQIIASRAFEGRPGPWVAVIRPLLDNKDGLTRLEAAQAIAPVDPDAARRVLGTALADPNPVVRYESAKTMEETPALRLTAGDITALRQRLRDADPAVRLAAAGTLLRLARE